MTSSGLEPATFRLVAFFLGSKARPARKADNLNAICEPLVKKLWDPQRLTALWAFTAWYSDSFIFDHKVIRDN
jgi:hypothetical protein